MHILPDLACPIRRFPRGALLAAAWCCAMMSPAGSLRAAAFTEFVDPNPAAGNQFGASVVALSTGNVVITSPSDDAGGVDAGAVYLFSGSSGALISTLRGSTVGDQVGGGGVTALSNGNYVVLSQNWDNGAIANAGAVTWGSGTTGVNGTVSAANSLVGSTAGDFLGGFVRALSNGNYVVLNPSWDNGAIAEAGAATWGSGTAGITGAVSAANSLVGSTANDQVGAGVTALSNGHCVVASFAWDNGAIADVGAVTWGSGTTGVTGALSAANSLVGSTANDLVGVSGVTALSNGHYVVRSESWNNGAVVGAGAATWGSGTAGVIGAVSAANSLVGSTAGDQVGGSDVTALPNGNYVVPIPTWDNGAIADAGAATWGSGTVGVSGAVSAANSLVGSTAGDFVANAGVTALSNGNYVVASPTWDNGATLNAGAATWASGTVGVTGAVSAANSLVGSTASDLVANAGVTALTNGNYVVASSVWDDGATTDAGAATWGSGTVGIAGAVSAANSLVGASAGDKVSGSGVTPLTNGNYVVRSLNWNNGGSLNAGAVTWGSGTVGATGAVSTLNSLFGSSTGSQVGSGGVIALANGNYVVGSPLVNSAFEDVGAATWANGATGAVGGLSAVNSLIGHTANDRVGSSLMALSSGNYVVLSPNWDNGIIVNAGAVTWGNGLTGVIGTVTAGNSLVGSTTSDQLGSSVTALSNGNYVVRTSGWDNGGIVNAGAATWGSGKIGVIGAVSAATSLIGASANTSLQPIIEDNVNKGFIARFAAEGGGRVRFGPPGSPEIVSAVDIAGDQGGWLRVTFNRSIRDDENAVPPVGTYGVWRLVPGAVASSAGRAHPDAAVGSPPDRLTTGSLRALLSTNLDPREVEGRLYVTGSRAAETAFTFPPGTWELVTGVPAVQQTQYVVAVPTISDAVANDYVVTAHTTTPSIWFRSNTVSGQSVDNMTPAGVGGEPVALALEGVRPNPASGSGLHVAFALPTPAPARLELLDVGGRRVLTREVHSMGAGRHRVNLAEGRSVAPGVYWVRLTQGTNRRTTRVAVLD